MRKFIVLIIFTGKIIFLVILNRNILNFCLIQISSSVLHRIMLNNSTIQSYALHLYLYMLTSPFINPLYSIDLLTDTYSPGCKSHWVEYSANWSELDNAAVMTKGVGVLTVSPQVYNQCGVMPVISHNINSPEGEDMYEEPGGLKLSSFCHSHHR